jgi:MFS family permease
MQERQARGDSPTIGSFLRHPATAAVVSLGFTQIISWGTTLYALGVLGKPIAADTGWSQSLVFGGLTVGLLVSGAVSARVGRYLDRHGGRLIMSLGSVLNAVGLVLLAQVHDPYSYLAAWAFLGLAMRLTLYDAAFGALVQVTPSRGRRAISYLTLFGGLASTVFWPIGHALNSAHGWRTTLLVFAVINLLVCLPLHVLGLARRETPKQAEYARATGNAETQHAGRPLEGSTRCSAPSPAPAPSLSVRSRCTWCRSWRRPGSCCPRTSCRSWRCWGSAELGPRFSLPPSRAWLRSAGASGT